MAGDPGQVQDCFTRPGFPHRSVAATVAENTGNVFTRGEKQGPEYIGQRRVAQGVGVGAGSFAGGDGGGQSGVQPPHTQPVFFPEGFDDTHVFIIGPERERGDMFRVFSFG